MSDTLSENYSKLNKRYQEIKNQLADLEAKFAESEKSKESYRLQNEHHHLQLLQFYSRLGVEAFGADIHEKALETLMITKENLAEKDKELAYMTEQAKKFNNEAQKYFEDAYCNDFHKQDKISFCIEQLEKVKEFIGRQLYITTKDCNDLDEAEAKGCNELREETIKEIDNQIKQLKEMM